jgi:hypothetical protein
MPIVDILKQREKGETFFNENCAICMEVLVNSEGKSCRQIFSCKHTFHSKCLLGWLNVNESCPNCKEQLNKKSCLEKEKKMRQRQLQISDKKSKSLKGNEGMELRIGTTQRQAGLNSSTNAFLPGARAPVSLAPVNVRVESQNNRERRVRQLNRRNRRIQETQQVMVQGRGEDLDSSMVNLNQSVSHFGGE